MPAERLPRRALFAEADSDWRRKAGGQHQTWKKLMKRQTVTLARVGRCHLPGWSPRDNGTQWLQTLAEMAANRQQWKICIEKLCPADFA